jgi:hypothetical protein
MVWHSKLRPFKLGERHSAGFGSNLFAPALIAKHLAELEARKARFAAAHPELGPMELRRAYWEKKPRGPRISETLRRRRAKHKEVNDFIRLVKWNMKHNLSFGNEGGLV